MKTITNYFFSKEMQIKGVELTENGNNVILTQSEYSAYIDVIKYSNWLIQIMNLAINEYHIDLLTCVKLILDNKLKGTQRPDEYDYCIIFLDTIDNNQKGF